MGAWEDGFAAGYREALVFSEGATGANLVRDSARAPMRKKAKRKVGKYQKVFGKKLKALKKKHPRTSASALMKRAHRETKKAMK